VHHRVVQQDRIAHRVLLAELDVRVPAQATHTTHNTQHTPYKCVQRVSHGKVQTVCVVRVVC
jgi:hypothetical protein